MRKRNTSVWLMVVLVTVLVAAGITLAWLVSSSTPLRNTFTVGKIAISLQETKGNNFKMIPGTDHSKDPVVTVKAGSEACWLFFQATKSSDFDSFMTFETAEGWTPLGGEEGVWYREVAASDTDVSFSLLAGDEVSVLETVTEEMLNGLSKNPTVSFKAYAVQREGIETAELAWQSFEKEE